MDVVSALAQRSLLAFSAPRGSARALGLGAELLIHQRSPWPAFVYATHRAAELAGGLDAFRVVSQTTQGRSDVRQFVANNFQGRALLSFLAETVLPADFPTLDFTIVEATDRSFRLLVRPRETLTLLSLEPCVLLIAGLLASLPGSTAASRPIAPVVSPQERGAWLIELRWNDAPWTQRAPSQADANVAELALQEDIATWDDEQLAGLIIAANVLASGTDDAEPAAAAEALLSALRTARVSAACLWIAEPEGHVAYGQDGSLDAYALTRRLVANGREVGLLQLAATGVSDWVRACEPVIAADLARLVTEAPVRRARARSWSATELAVAEAVAADRTAKEISAQLGVSTSTVNALLATLYRDMGVASRADLMLLWRDFGPFGVDKDPRSSLPPPSSTQRGALRVPPLGVSAATLARPSTPGTMATALKARFERLMARRREIAWLQSVAVEVSRIARHGAARAHLVSSVRARVVGLPVRAGDAEAAPASRRQG
jgi:DNA-binding CsgD family transcriptional regulator